MTGLRFGSIVVVGLSKRTNKSGSAYWKCICDCGREIETSGTEIRRGKVRTCGRKHPKNNGHGHTLKGKSPTYRTWNNMHNRCRAPSCPSYYLYGGRGIRVCERWKSFENFLADMGERPSGCSIERIDHSLDYSPENCRWATSKEQSYNKRSNRLVDAFGVKKPLAQWAAEHNLRSHVIRWRIENGWSPEEAITTPKAPRPWAGHGR